MITIKVYRETDDVAKMKKKNFFILIVRVSFSGGEFKQQK
jgi:hypothetical protein